LKPTNLDYCQNTIEEMFKSVAPMIGIHVMLLVLEYSLWKTQDLYDEVKLITFSEKGVSLDNLKELDEEKARLVAHEFMISIITTLGRLVGIQLASKLTEQFQILKEEY